MGVPFRLYVISDRNTCGDRTLPDVFEQAARAGVQAFQLREKDLPKSQLETLAREIQEKLKPYPAKLLINNDTQMAQNLGLDGVHFPSQKRPILEERLHLGETALIGASTHNKDEVSWATSQNVDFLVFGPVFETPSKKSFGPPQGLEKLKAAVDAANSTPVFAIGGITPDLTPKILETGAYGVATIRSIMESKNIEKTVEAYRKALGGI